MKDSFDISETNAELVKSFEKDCSGIPGDIIWISTLDRETRPSHGLMDGVKRSPDGFFEGPGKYRAPYPGWMGLPKEERENCRCTIAFMPKGIETPFRRTKEDGIIPYITWKEWAKRKGWTEENGWHK